MGSPLSLCLSLVSLHPSLCAFCFHYSFSLCFSIYILSLFMPLTLFPFYYLVAIIFIQQLVPINLCFLLYHSTYPAPIFLFFPAFVVAINIFLWLVLPSLSFTLFPLSMFFNIVTFLSPLMCYFPLLFYLCPILLDFLSLLPPLYPFLVSVLLSACPMPPHLSWLCNGCTTSIYPLYLLLPFFFYLITNILPQLTPPLPLSSICEFFWAQKLPNGNESREDFKVSSEVPPFPSLPIL